jgi:hypothetical protein
MPRTADTPGVPRFLDTRLPARAAQDGLRGTGRTLPHAERIQQAFGAGHDVAAIHAHFDRDAASACDALGATAYASGSGIAFATQPDLWLAAHEAAHVEQQRHGGAPAGGVDTPGDAHERQASAVADRVAAGKSAKDLLPRGEPRGGATGAVQRYSIEPLAGGRARIGAGRQTALFGAQSLYAAPGLIGGANSTLQSAGTQGSYIELKASGGAVDLDGASLSRVAPEFLSKPGSPHAEVEAANAPGGADTEGTANGPMALWTDCGRSSAAVTGSAGGGDRSVVYRDNGVVKLGRGIDDPTVSKWLKGEPNRMANQVYMELLPGFIQRADNEAFLVEGIHYDMRDSAMLGAALGGALGAGLGTFAGAMLGGIGALPGAVIGAAAGGIAGAALGGRMLRRAFRTPANIAEAKFMYLALGDVGMDKFDQEAGINFHANPEIGESYSMATEGDMPGFASHPGESTWNYHWAGVVMKDGADNITLENYAVTAKYAASMKVRQVDFINRQWMFGMYGTVDPDQTFQRAHLDTLTHGTHATSIAVRTDQ